MEDLLVQGYVSIRRYAEMNDPVLTIVVPCFNEEEVLPETILELHQLDGVNQ